jgi:hypothetical protein
MNGLGRKKPTSTEITPAPSMDSTPVPSWMSGEAPMTPPKKKKGPRIDSGGQLSRSAMRAA